MRIRLRGFVEWLKDLFVDEEARIFKEMHDILEENQRLLGKDAKKTIGGVPGIFYDG